MFFWSNQHIGVAMIPTSVQILYTIHTASALLILDSFAFSHWLHWFLILLIRLILASLRTSWTQYTMHHLYRADWFSLHSHIDYIDICAHLEHNTQCRWTSSSIMIISTVALNFYFVEDPLMEMWHFKWMSLFYFYVYVLCIFYLYLYLYLYSQLPQRTILYFYVTIFSDVREFSHKNHIFFWKSFF